MAAWDHELCIASDEIDQLRRNYIVKLKPVFEETLAKLLDLPDLTLSYFRGWDKTSALQDILDKNIERDRVLGYTQAGPQRADLRVRVGKITLLIFFQEGSKNWLFAR